MSVDDERDDDAAAENSLGITRASSGKSVSSSITSTAPSGNRSGDVPALLRYIAQFYEDKRALLGKNTASATMGYALSPFQSSMQQWMDIVREFVCVLEFSAILFNAKSLSLTNENARENLAAQITGELEWRRVKRKKVLPVELVPLFTSLLATASQV